MRALLEIDETVLAAAEREATRRGKSLSAFVELALSAFVAPPERGTGVSRERVDLPTFRGEGLQPGVNLDNSAALLELMESPDASFSAWIGLGLRAPLNPNPRFRSDDDLWR